MKSTALVDWDWVTLTAYPCTPSVPGVESSVINRCVLTVDCTGQRTLCKPTVAKPMIPQSIRTMKHKAIFSLHAFIIALSCKPPTDCRRILGAQNVTAREKKAHRLKLPSSRGATAPDADGERF